MLARMGAEALDRVETVVNEGAAPDEAEEAAVAYARRARRVLRRTDILVWVYVFWVRKRMGSIDENREEKQDGYDVVCKMAQDDWQPPPSPFPSPLALPI